MPDPTCSVRDVCERYAVSEYTVLGWIKRGELRAINVGRSPAAKKPRWRITAAALEVFETSRRSESVPLRSHKRKRQSDVVKFY